MADNEEDQRPSLQDLPDELITNILKFLTWDELDSIRSTSKRILKIVEQKSLRSFLPVYPSYESNHSNIIICNTFLKRVYKYHDKIDFIKILSHEAHKNLVERGDFVPCREWFFLSSIDHSNVLSRCSLKKIHLEIIDGENLHSIKIGKFLLIQTLRSVIIVIQQNNNNEKSFVHCSFVKDHNPLDLYIKNLRPPFLENCVFSNVENVKSSDYLTVLESSHPISVSNLNTSPLTFPGLCTRCPKLEKLSIKINKIMSEKHFLRVLELKNLNLLELSMQYNFSRNKLIKVLENSNFSQLVVKISEMGMTFFQPQTVTLKEGRITIYFSSRADDLTNTKLTL